MALRRPKGISEQPFQASTAAPLLFSRLIDGAHAVPSPTAHAPGGVRSCSRALIPRRRGPAQLCGEGDVAREFPPPRRRILQLSRPRGDSDATRGAVGSKPRCSLVRLSNVHAVFEKKNFF